MTGALVRTAGRISAALLLVAGLAGAADDVAGQGTPASNATIHLLAIDADPTGNGWTSLGPIDPCFRTEVGKEVDVDVVVDAIPPEREIIGWQMTIRYDPAILQVVAVDKSLLLAAEGRYQGLDVFSDPLPDNDGSIMEAMADLASNSPPGANMESGPGVLMRMTVRAKAPGLASIYVDQNADILINDNVNVPIGIDQIAAATIAVGEDCPTLAPEAQITVVPASPTMAPQVNPPGATAGLGDAAGTSPAQTQGPGAAVSAIAPPPTAVPAAPGLGEGLEGGSSDALPIIGSVLGALAVAALMAGGWLLYWRRVKPI